MIFQNKKIVAIVVVCAVVVGLGGWAAWSRYSGSKQVYWDGHTVHFDNKEFAATSQRDAAAQSQSTKNAGFTVREPVGKKCAGEYAIKLSNGETVCTHGSD